MEIFVTSDQHFFHNNIIKYSDRPVKSLAEMHHVLKIRWNEVVTNQDIVYILGDFSFGSYSKTLMTLYALNGNKKIIPGGHDSWINKRAMSHSDIEILDQIVELKYKETWFVFCHYPIEEWNRKHYNSIHLHGHSHGNLNRIVANRYDIGVDTNNLYPYMLKDFVI